MAIFGETDFLKSGHLDHAPLIVIKVHFSTLINNNIIHTLQIHADLRIYVNITKTHAGI